MMNQVDQTLPKQTVLVVDDMADNIMILDHILRPYYRVKAANRGELALQMANSAEPPHIILLDVMMPEMDGFEVCRQLKDNENTKRIPVIFITAMGEAHDEAHGLAVGAVDYLTKPVSPSIVLARVKTHLALYDQNRVLEERVLERTRELERSQQDVVSGMQALEQAQSEMLERLAQAAEFRDDDTGHHTRRVGEVSCLLASRMGFPPSRYDTIRRAAMLHDVFKIGIPDQILLKPGRLSEDEFAIMKTHTTIGAQILRDGRSELMRVAHLIALTHHERWDGTGYPQGLKGNDIPIEGQMVAIADVFDALTHSRPYKEAWPLARAIEEIHSLSGKHFNPSLIDAFCTLPHERLI